MSVIGAFMVPHPPLLVEEVGHRRERAIENTIEAYRKAAKRIKEWKPDTIVLTTPHGVMYSDYFHISPGLSAKGDFGQFGAPGVQLQADYDWEFTGALCEKLDEADFPGGMLGEKDVSLDHGTMVPLYFINQEYTDYKLVRVCLSGQSLLAHYTLGQYIKKTGEELNRKIAFIASGDLSHKLKTEGPYGFDSAGPEYDAKLMKTMGSGNFMELFHFKESFCEQAAECGHRSFVIMAGALDQTEVSAQAISYEGPFGVGYGICEFQCGARDINRNFGEQYLEEKMQDMEYRRKNEDAYVNLARRSLESFIIGKYTIDIPENTPEELQDHRAGVFVSIKKDGRLRGCIGTTAPTKESIAKEIISNAISAGVHDPRFDPIQSEELKELIYSVDVLGKTERISSPEELDVSRYGVIVSNGCRRGLLLPNLEGIDTVSEQIAIARQKAGIGEREEIFMERFEVVRHT